jgi:hypothetical protein
MGRHKKYFTEKEKVCARNKRRMKYYWKNQEKEKKKALERYYANKNINNK